MRISDWSSDVCSSDLGNLRESGFIDSGHGRRQFQVRPGDGKPVSLLVEHDRGERFQRPLGETLAFKREADRHGEAAGVGRSEEHTSELQSLMRTSYAVFCLKTKRTRIRCHRSVGHASKDPYLL